jgi:hypothetical protein
VLRCIRDECTGFRVAFAFCRYLEYTNTEPGAAGLPIEVGVFVNGRRIGVYHWFSESGELIEEHDFGDAQ